jgi:hypothetical protein
MNVNKDDSYPSLAALLEDDVIEVGHDADLRFDSNGVRVWVHRTGLADGEPYENAVSVEALLDSNQESRWVTVATYDGNDPPSTIGNRVSFGELYFNHSNLQTLENLCVLLDDLPLPYGYEVIVSDDGTISLKTDLWIDEAGFLHTEERQ